MPLLVKTQRVMGWKTLLWCNQITDCPPIETHRQRSARPFARSGAVRVACCRRAPRARGCVESAGRFPAPKHGHARWTARWFRRSPARLNPVSCDGSAPTRAEPCWRWQSGHAVAQRALRVIESEATGALPHSVVMFVTMGVDCGGLIGLTLPFEHSDETGFAQLCRCWEPPVPCWLARRWGMARIIDAAGGAPQWVSASALTGRRLPGARDVVEPAHAGGAPVPTPGSTWPVGQSIRRVVDEADSSVRRRPPAGEWHGAANHGAANQDVANQDSEKSREDRGGRSDPDRSA